MFSASTRSINNNEYWVIKFTKKSNKIVRQFVKKSVKDIWNCTSKCENQSKLLEAIMEMKKPENA